jgi:hypothetical protein
MNFLSIGSIEDRIAELMISYQKQLDKSGKPGYDHTLTEYLKKDLNWLQKEKNKLENSELGSLASESN